MQISSKGGGCKQSTCTGCISRAESARARHPQQLPRQRRRGRGKETTMRSIGGQAGPGSETSTRPIGIWVAAGLSLAVIGVAARSGVFIVSAAVLLAPMVYVFARLREQAPDARTTSDFVGAVLGERGGVFAGLVQLVAYLLLAVKFARSLAFGLLGLLGVFLGVVPNPGSTSTTPILAVGSITAVVAAGVIAHLLSTRGISWVVAILAAAGLLAYFCIAVVLV